MLKPRQHKGMGKRFELPAEIAADLMKAIDVYDLSVIQIVRYLKREHGINVTRPTVYAWLDRQKRKAAV